MMGEKAHVRRRTRTSKRIGRGYGRKGVRTGPVNKPEVTEAIKRVLAGDTSAYEVLFRECDEPLRSFVGSRHGRQDADFINEVATRTHEYALEHLKEYKVAFSHLLSLTTNRLIITIPYQYSFDHPEHCNYWSDKVTAKFKDVREFAELCRPYKTAISKIITKPQDAGKQYAYLIVVDRSQNGDN